MQLMQIVRSSRIRMLLVAVSCVLFLCVGILLFRESKVAHREVGQVLYAKPAAPWPVLLRSLKGHSGQVFSVAFAPDGKIIASGSNDGTVKIWDAQAGRLKRTLVASSKSMPIPLPTTPMTTKQMQLLAKRLAKSKLRPFVKSVVFSPLGETLASAGQDGVIVLWNTRTWTPKWKLKGHREAINTLAFSPDGTLLCSGSGNETGTLKLWNAQTGKLRWASSDNIGEVPSVAFSPDGKTIATAGGQILNRTRLWDTQTGRLKRTLPEESESLIAFSPDGTLLVTGSSGLDSPLKIWNVRTDKVRKVLTRSGLIADAVAFSPDGRILAFGNQDQRIFLWDMQTNKKPRILQGRSIVNAIAFSPDSVTLASGHYDGMIRLWRVR